MVKTPRFHCRGAGSIPGRGTKIPHAAWRGQKLKSVSLRLSGRVEVSVLSPRAWLWGVTHAPSSGEQESGRRWSLLPGSLHSQGFPPTPRPWFLGRAGVMVPCRLHLCPWLSTGSSVGFAKSAGQMSHVTCCPVVWALNVHGRRREGCCGRAFKVVSVSGLLWLQV